LVRSKAYSRVEHMRGASLEKALALRANIRLGWKSLLGKNTVAFNEY